MSPSASVPRPGAWRCTAGSIIYDPCFETARRSGEVVCASDPARNQPGLSFKASLLPLTRSPDGSRKGATLAAWILKLADGSVCYARGGPPFQVDGQPVRYSCADVERCRDKTDCPKLTGVYEDLKPGKAWVAQKVKYTINRLPPPEFKPLERQFVAVDTVWR